MGCPIFIQEEECFCLHDNCRYYDVRYQKCVYGNNNTNKHSLDNTSCKDVDFERAEKLNKTEVFPLEQIDEIVNLSAKEIWDRLSTYHREYSIPAYDTLINDLIKLVKKTPTVHYLTQMSLDFWYQKIERLENYRNILEKKEKLQQ